MARITLQTLLLFWLACGVIGWMIGASKEHGFAGFMLGFFFGPIGCTIAIFLGGNQEEDQPVLKGLGIVCLLGIWGLVALGVSQMPKGELARRLRMQYGLASRVSAPRSSGVVHSPDLSPIAYATPFARRQTSAYRAPAMSPAEVNAEILRRYGGQP